MERYGVALIACMLVLAGCAGPRVLSTDDLGTATVAQAEPMNPFEFEFSQPLRVTPVSDELGAPPLPLPPSDALAALPADDVPPPPALPETAEELAPVEDAPAANDVPAAADFPPPAPCAKRLRCCKPVCPPSCKPVCKPACKPRCGKSMCCGKCDKCPCPDPCGDPCGGYMGGAFTIGPGLGLGVEGGINFKRTKRALWSWELAMVYQDFTDALQDGDFRNSGKMQMARTGLRWRFQPCCRGHITARAGVAWMLATGAPELLDLATIDAKGDYVGGYVGIGYEFDLGSRWSTGPELMYFYGFEAGGNGDTASVPTLLWHLNYRF